MIASSNFNIPLPADFAVEIWSSLHFFVDYARGKPNTHTSRPAALANGSTDGRPTFGDAFGIYSGGAAIRRVVTSDSHLPVIQDDEDGVYGDVGHHGYGKTSAEAIPMHAMDDPLNADDLAYSVPPRQVQYDRNNA
jgi:hypothetical protein